MYVDYVIYVFSVPDLIILDPATLYPLFTFIIFPVCTYIQYMWYVLYILYPGVHISSRCYFTFILRTTESNYTHNISCGQLNSISHCMFPEVCIVLYHSKSCIRLFHVYFFFMKFSISCGTVSCTFLLVTLLYSVPLYPVPCMLFTVPTSSCAPLYPVPF